ncbi:MAG: hypothetical protein U0234_04045 [Sandaracinus sp.]
MSHEVVWCTHGRQGIGLACTHVAHAIDSGEQVGFFWGPTWTPRDPMRGVPPASERSSR